VCFDVDLSDHEIKVIDLILLICYGCRLLVLEVVL